MKGIDPKYAFWLGVIVIIEQAIGHGGIKLTNMFPLGWQPAIIDWSNALAFCGLTIMTYQAGYSSDARGPLVSSLTPKALAIFATFIAVMFFTVTDARAGDVAPAATPAKAPAASTWLNGYPYDSSGMYAGMFTKGGGGSVAAQVPGVTSASLTTTTASIGGTVGYAWGSRTSQIAYSIEGDFGATNFNGSNAGFAVSGPLFFEQTAFVWMPVSLIQNMFSALNIPNPFASVPPFPTNPAGITASNVQAGFGAGLFENDMTLAYQGVGSNKVWNVGPKIEFDLMEQLSNASALREFVEFQFPQKGVLFGAHQSSATPSTMTTAGIKYLF